MTELHLDTDFAGDIDDICALALVLNWPAVRLRAVTTVADDAGRRAGYVRYALSLAGHSDVPVAAGADVAQGYYRDRPGLPDEVAYWPEAVAPAPTACDDALDLLAASIAQGAIIVAIGPYTNLALLEQRTPGTLRQANLYLMGGYLFPPRSGFPEWDYTNDYNAQVDAASALAVMQHASPTLVPLAVTAETALRRSYLPALQAGGPLAQLIAHQAEVFARDQGYEAKYGQTCAGLPDDLINFQHDPLACAIALGWNEGVEIAELPVQSTISNGWLEQRVATDGTPTRIATRIDGQRFSEHWLCTVASM